MVAEVNKIVPGGVQHIVEVNPATNAGIDARVLGSGGSVALYADNGGEQLTVPVRASMVTNARWQFVLLYTAPAAAKAQAVEDVGAALLDGAIGVGEDRGLPLHHFPLEQAAQAHQAVEDGAVGKVLIDVQD